MSLGCTRVSVVSQVVNPRLKRVNFTLEVGPLSPCLVVEGTDQAEPLLQGAFMVQSRAELDLLAKDLLDL